MLVGQVIATAGELCVWTVNNCRFLPIKYQQGENIFQLLRPQSLCQNIVIERKKLFLVIYGGNNEWCDKGSRITTCCLLIPIFAYQTFCAERLKNNIGTKILMSIIWGLSIILCMSFPAFFGLNYRLDIRVIPLLLGTLYGGTGTGIFLALVVILYRVCSGIDVEFFNAVLTLICTMPIVLLFQKSFKKVEKEKRNIIAILLAIFYIVVGNSWFFILRGELAETLMVQAIHLIFVVIATWMFVVLNEYIIGIHQLRIELQNSDKSRIINNLTSVFAHEIRNPLQTTRGFLQLLTHTDSQDKKSEYIQISIEELDRANEIINEFLAFGKPSTNNNEIFNAGDQLRRVINIIQTYSGSRNVEIITSVSQDCFIHANPFKLNQALINILKNAIESMPNGGTVWATCTAKEDQFVKISIRDEGVGMTKEELDRLGTPFYSLKDSGTGLGMMASFQIIRSFNGKIHVTSDKGTGTKFEILLPIAREG